MGLVLSLYNARTNSFVANTGDSNLINADQNQLFYDYVEASFGYRPRKLAIGQFWTEEGTQRLFRVPPTATNGQIFDLFLEGGDSVGLVDESISSTSTILVVLIVMLILVIGLVIYHKISKDSAIVLGCVILFIIMVQILQQSPRSSTFPTEPVGISSSKNLSSHHYTGRFQPTSSNNIPLQMAKWAQAQIGQQNPDSVFPPISESVTQVDGIVGMTGQLVYKDGPLEMEKITLQPGTLVPLHSHNDTPVAAFRISGNMYYGGQDKKMQLWEKGELVVPIGLKHTALSQDLCTFYTIHLSGDSLLTKDFVRV